MLKKFSIAACVLVTCAALCALPVFSQKKRSYVGIDECKKCHAAEAIGNQQKIWESTPHARAYRTLRQEAAQKIALKLNIEQPQNDLRCLKCHTTGGGTSDVTRTEGVGCEACHGPASGYASFSDHASFDDREGAYRKGISNGMYPIVGIDGIKVRERVCKSCHTTKRPCADPAKGDTAAELALSKIANFVFSHPVRK